jgi:hypothetical protein
MEEYRERSIRSVMIFTQNLWNCWIVKSAGLTKHHLHHHLIIRAVVPLVIQNSTSYEYKSIFFNELTIKNNHQCIKPRGSIRSMSPGDVIIIPDHDAQ